MTERGNAAPVLEPVAAAPRPAIMRAERLTVHYKVRGSGLGDSGVAAGGCGLGAVPLQT